MRLQPEALWFFSYLVYMPWFGQAKIDYCARPGSKVTVCKTNSLKSFHEASKTCAFLGKWNVLYETPECLEDMDICQEELDIVKDIGRPVWWNMYRKHSNNWLTVTGEAVNRHIRINGINPSGDCAAIAIAPENLAATTCSGPDYPTGFVCEFKGRCPLFLEGKCFKLTTQRTVYVGYNVNVRNWHTARSVCRQFDGDLATPRSTQEIKLLVNYIKRHRRNTVDGKTQRRVGSFFVGITKEHWTLPGITTGVNMMKPHDSRWTLGQPGEGDCVILTEEGRNTTSCQAYHATVCQVMGNGADVSEYITSTTEHTSTKQTSQHAAEPTTYPQYPIITIGLLSAILCVLLVQLVIVIVLLGIHRRSKQLSDPERPEELKNPVYDGEKTANNGKLPENSDAQTKCDTVQSLAKSTSTTALDEGQEERERLLSTKEEGQNTCNRDLKKEPDTHTDIAPSPM